MSEMKYKVQYFDDNHNLTWSEWYSFDTPLKEIKEKRLLSIVFSETLTWDHPEYKHWLEVNNK